MSADQGLPPEGQPPDDASASGPNALPPWLRDDAEDEVVPVTPPSPIRPITPPPPPPEPALPPWLQDADEVEQVAPAAPAPDPDDWLSGGDALPDSADSSLTFDEWAAQRQAAARPYDIEEEVPDLSDELTQAAPGTGSLKEAETLPNWFLGMDEISSEELPDWFAEPETAEEQAPGTAAQDDVWTPQPATSPLPDEEELPDLDLWAGGLAEADEFSPTANDNDQSWPASAALAADDDDFPLDVPGSAVTGADDLNANIEGSGFDEPAFEWLPTAETPAPQSDLIEEPDLDEFLASPSVGAAPPLPAAPGMDEQAAQSWLTELEGMVAEVSAMPTEDAPASEPDHPEDDAWLAAFGGAAVAAASVENAEALFNEEPSFDFMETPEPEAETPQPERPVAEYGSESEDDLWAAAFGGAAVAAASVGDAGALFSEAPSFDFSAAPEPDAEADGLFGGAAPLADLPGANNEGVNEDDAWLASFGVEPP
ncbi:MAG TPA: hypothetical protein VER79_01930, partial [Candidatus Limnocylindrales bacterium]|nr:hypothetical protein [Candidatus Limnocylindrales bacterium]